MMDIIVNIEVIVIVLQSVSKSNSTTNTCHVILCVGELRQRMITQSNPANRVHRITRQDDELEPMDTCSVGFIEMFFNIRVQSLRFSIKGHGTRTNGSLHFDAMFQVTTNRDDHSRCMSSYHL